MTIRRVGYEDRPHTGTHHDCSFSLAMAVCRFAQGSGVDVRYAAKVHKNVLVADAGGWLCDAQPPALFRLRQHRIVGPVSIVKYSIVDLSLQRR